MAGQPQEFQSAPAIAGGRSRRAVCIAASGQPVSIRARHRWRAFPASARPALVTGSCFNPRPPSLAGVPRFDISRKIYYLVSIRARHRWRAFPALRAHAPGRPKRFNPRPPSLAGVPQVNGETSPNQMFQSAPAIAGGRSSSHVDVSTPRVFLLLCANPPADVETAPERNAQSEKFIGKTTRYEGREPMGNPAIASGSR